VSTTPHPLDHPHLPSEVADRRPHLGARLQARLTAAALDRRLVAGADPSASRPLAARAAQLCARGRRHALAHTLERTVREAREGRRDGGARVPVAWADVLANVPQLLALADALRAEWVSPAGVVLVRSLLCDGLSPLYHPVAPDALRRAIDEARAALTPKEAGPWT
jgi:hypothetical protein